MPVYNGKPADGVPEKIQVRVVVLNMIAGLRDIRKFDNLFMFWPW